jgi:DNA-binding CsgD family transcriptional regulator
MDPIPLTSALEYLRDSSADSEFWPEALPLISAAFGGVGAACFATNDQTAGVEWAFMCGPAAARTSNYVEHYAQLDLYLPRLRNSKTNKWMSITGCLPKRVLQRSEWYQDFVRPLGVADVLGAEVHRSGSRRIYFGLHFDTIPTWSPEDARLKLALDGIAAASASWQERRMLAVGASLGAWTIDRHPDALFIVYKDGRVVQMNAAAEHLLSRNRVLTVERGRLAATDASDAESLLALITAAAGSDTPGGSERRTLVGATQGRDGQLLTAYPLPNAWFRTGLVIVRATDLFAEPPVAGDMRQIFGLSLAEDRLARALVRGKTLQEMSDEFGVSMPTLRVQVRSVFRKCGVKRQVDLVRVLLRAS